MFYKYYLFVKMKFFVINYWYNTCDLCCFLCHIFIQKDKCPIKDLYCLATRFNSACAH